MAQEPLIRVVYYDVERLPDDRPGAGEMPHRLFERVRDDIVAACRKHGLVGPEDVKASSDYDKCIYWVVDDQYNDERYQYVEVSRPEGFTVVWLRDVMAALRKHPHWGVGVTSVPPGYVLIFEDRLLVSVPLFQGCRTAAEVAARAQLQIDLNLLVRADHDDASLERLSQATGMDRAPVERLNLTKVSDAGLVFLVRLSRVRTVSLNGASISDAGLMHLQAVTGLRGLGLADTRITDAGLAHLSNLSALKSLGLSGCRISDHGLARLRSLHNLEALQLGNTDVTDAGMAHLAAFSNLKELALDHCRVGDAGIKHLRGLPCLETLELDGTALTDEGSVHLRSLVTLKHLHLKETGVTDRGVRSLRQALPGCDVHFGKE